MSVSQLLKRFQIEGEMTPPPPPTNILSSSGIENSWDAKGAPHPPPPPLKKKSILPYFSHPLPHTHTRAI